MDFHDLVAVVPCSRYLNVGGLLPTLALLIFCHEICGKYSYYEAVCLTGCFGLFFWGKLHLELAGNLSPTCVQLMTCPVVGVCMSISHLEIACDLSCLLRLNFLLWVHVTLSKGSPVNECPPQEKNPPPSHSRQAQEKRAGNILLSPAEQCRGSPLLPHWILKLTVLEHSLNERADPFQCRLSMRCPELLRTFTLFSVCWVGTAFGHYHLEAYFSWMT